MARDPRRTLAGDWLLSTRRMTSNADEPSPKPNSADNRRWLIGICISLAFGIFSAVMAWLNYADRTKATPASQRPSAPAVADPRPAAPTGNQPTREHGKGRRKD